MMMDGMGMMIWGVFLLGLLLILIFVVVVVAAVKWLGDRKSPLVMRENALDILKKRYAKGEIKKEEYERIKKDVE